MHYNSVTIIHVSASRLIIQDYEKKKDYTFVGRELPPISLILLTIINYTPTGNINKLNQSIH